jgi:hypothetical protein
MDPTSFYQKEEAVHIAIEERSFSFLLFSHTRSDG